MKETLLNKLVEQRVRDGSFKTHMVYDSRLNQIIDEKLRANQHIPNPTLKKKRVRSTMN